LEQIANDQVPCIIFLSLTVLLEPPQREILFQNQMCMCAGAQIFS